MGEIPIPKWLQKFIQRLMPSQKSTGAGAVQMGNVAGSVTNVQLTQHIYAAPLPQAMPVRAQTPVTEAHKEVLTLMDPLPESVRITVLSFMRREFGTAMIKELGSRDLNRVRLYVLKVRQAIGIQVGQKDH